MDARAILHSVAPVSTRQFAAFRIAFGVYLAVHFAHLIGWGEELFSSAGAIGDASLNPTHGIFPNLLASWDSPAAVTFVLVALTALSVCFALGVARRPVAVLLWYGWMCLFNRNVLISNPGIPYVGLMLLLTALVPAREAWRVRVPLAIIRQRARSADGPFEMPGMVFAAAWALMAVGYTFSGLVKLQSPSWLDGTAMWHLANNPLARSGWLRDTVSALPLGMLQLMTWKALALEVLFLPLAMWRATRPLVWLALVVMHLGIVSLVSFADLTAGMLMLHAFTFDGRWLTMTRVLRARAWRRPRSAEPSPVAGAA